MVFMVHLLDLSESSPQHVFDDTDFNYEQFPGVPPAVFPKSGGQVRIESTFSIEAVCMPIIHNTG